MRSSERKHALPRPTTTAGIVRFHAERAHKETSILTRWREDLDNVLLGLPDQEGTSGMRGPRDRATRSPRKVTSTAIPQLPSLSTTATSTSSNRDLEIASSKHLAHQAGHPSGLVSTIKGNDGFSQCMLRAPDQFNASNLSSRNSSRLPSKEDSDVQPATLGRSTTSHALKRQAPNDEEIQTAAEDQAMSQTIDAHYVLMMAERTVMENALGAARAAAPDGVYVPETQKRRSLIQTPSDDQQQALLAFLPKTLMKCIQYGRVNVDQWNMLLESPAKSRYNPVLCRFPAALVFADASGFTRLTEGLASQPNGAEKIGGTINAFFGPIIDIVDNYGGDVIKFSGDALTIIWPAAEPALPTTLERSSYFSSAETPKRTGCMNINEAWLSASMAVNAAAACCLEIQRQIPNFSRTSVPGCELTMHIGVGYADVAMLQVGGLLGRWEFCLAGDALDQISIAEPLAKSGETVFSPEARELISDSFLFQDVECEHDGFGKLLGPGDGIKPVPVPSPWWDGATHPQISRSAMQLAKRYVPGRVQSAIATCNDVQHIGGYPEEMRRASTIFLSISGLDPAAERTATETNGLSGGRTTQLLMRLFQRAVYALEGTVNKLLVDDKGVLLLVVFGLPPLVHFADDPTRAVLCAMRLVETLEDEDLEGRAGVATGIMWCGVVGSTSRHEYTVMGKVVNLSARLMGKAPPHGILVDEPTKLVAEQVLEFEDIGRLSLKGISKTVRAFQFVGTHKNRPVPQGEVDELLLSWDDWAPREDMNRKLESFTNRSGVIFINGAGGCGKTELAEEVRCWARNQNWSVLSGQNMDPTGIFALPRLCLQMAFRELVRLASSNKLWRREARDLLHASLGKPKAKRDSSEKDQLRHTELYWMLVAMMRRSLGTIKSKKLENWMPLLTMVVTQLAFGPGMVSAMVERDEQHAAKNHFADLCSAVIDGFATGPEGESNGNGTLLILHVRRSSAFFESRDRLEFDAIRVLGELCMRRRASGPEDGEKNPLVLCIVSRESVMKDGALRSWATECGGNVLVADFTREQTTAFTQHVYGIEFPSLPHHTNAIGIIGKYVYDVTGGNPWGVITVLRDLESSGVVKTGPNNSIRLTSGSLSVKVLRDTIPFPQALVGMSFSAFEMLAPRTQMVLKAASTLREEFKLGQLYDGIAALSVAELKSICASCSHMLRVVRTSQEEGYTYRFYSLVLRHIISSLVLESQRLQITKRASLYHPKRFAAVLKEAAEEESELESDDVQSDVL